MKRTLVTEPDGGVLVRDGGVARRRLAIERVVAGGLQAGRRRPALASGALLAAVAFLPTLLSSPGRMPADTKLHLYLDPGRLTTDAPWTFDASQYAGWVPHQQITYLWPSGPWFWLWETVGVPDWVAHRLWLGAVFLAAGVGVRWAARTLGLGVTGALVAAIVYQLSPYVLPYVSRTSLMLLPWAGLGWIVGFTARAAIRGGWRDAAALALVVATVGSPNATALLMIAPAPLLWLLHAATSGIVGRRRALVTAARIGVLSFGTSLWWIAMVAVQGRHGAEVLAYSESLEAVSSTSTSSEVLRSLGYWIFYLRDQISASTSSSVDYLTSVPVILAGYCLLAVGLIGLAATRWQYRRYALMVFVTGALLGVGVHHLADPAPLTDSLVDDTESPLALALRSSTRAVPMMTLGLALGAGALVSAVRPARHWTRALVPIGIVVLAVVNMPSVWRHDYVDAALDRDQDLPSYWHDAVDALEAKPPGYRALQVPGQEFGAFRWGVTIDQPLPGITRRPVVTRDVLPLGSNQAMDLLLALDSRFQDDVVEPAALAPLARLFGADTLWIPNDVAFEQFRTPRPEETTRLFTPPPPGLGAPAEFGTPTVNAPSVDMTDDASVVSDVIGTPVAPLLLAPVTDPVPVIRAKQRTVVVSGSGDGVVDAAGAGLLEGHELIRYSADLGGDEPLDDVDALIVTDSNRRRAQRWNSSQDRVGYTEAATDSAASDDDIVTPDPADARLDLFPTDAAAQTTTVQRGPVTAVASSYGEPSGYRPEDRAAMAIDGDRRTAWRLGDRFFAADESIRLQTRRGIGHVTLRQPVGARWGRHISAIELRVSGQSARRAELGPASLRGGGQRVDVVPTAGPTTITITIADTASPTTVPGPETAAVGFAEIDVGLRPTREVVVLPSDLLDRADGRRAATPIAVVLTRLRADADNRYRSDPEPLLARQLTLPAELDVSTTVTARLAPRATDDVLQLVLGVQGPKASARVAGSPVASGLATVDDDPATAWITPFAFVRGRHLDVPLTSGSTVDSFTITQPDGDISPITALRVEHAGRSWSVPVPAPDAAGRSEIRLPVPIGGGAMRLVLDEVDGAVFTDRRYGEPVFKPAAISEISVGPRVRLPATVDLGCRRDLLRIDGVGVPVRLRGTTAELLDGAPFDVTPCGGDDATRTLAAGRHLVESTPGGDTGIDIDRVVLADGEIVPPGPAAIASTRVVSSSRMSRTIEVEGCPSGCWLVLGEGFNRAWTASAAGTELGPPEPVDGGFNGWWLPAGSTPTTVTVDWTAQRSVSIAAVISVVAVLTAVGLVIFGRRVSLSPRRAVGSGLVVAGEMISQRRAIVAAAAGTAAAGLVINPAAMLWVGAVGAAVCITRRPRLAAWAAVAVACYVALAVVQTVWRDDPPDDGSWVVFVEWLHPYGLTAVILTLLATLATSEGRDGS